MKTKILLLISVSLLFGMITSAQVKVDVKKKVNRETNQRANSNTDKVIDKGFDKLEEGIGSLFGKKKKKEQDTPNEAGDNQQQTQEEQQQLPGTAANGQPAPKMNIQWSRFDFVPGDEIIFEDALLIDEENGEFPSRWDLVEGNAEIMQANGENVICFPQGGEIVPYLKNSARDYLPDVFTLEFDAFFAPEYAHRFWVYFYDRKNQKSNDNEYATIYVNAIAFGNSEGTYPNAERTNWSQNGGWRHMSVAFTQGKLKIYMDDTRLINIPRYEANPSGISIQCDGYSGDTPEELQYIKNVRIAKGGVKYYDRVMQDGKIVCNGIKFDVNKATLKPESIGPINNIFELMQKQPDLKFSVEGHTDSDGDDGQNQTLSEARANTVMEQLVTMGVAADRLSCKGWGESKPIGGNDTPEGKANNRRVEFVKF
ncbi:OmpA family protein [Maribellus sp. CM-23]|uniref:OmpA family protein n=1 Tax=Maribellus sp. CM-23 TaxID=2781026 RepID=UPI001F4500EA|nr:OmpA family protein [Maribellus sp. CM-23]MCE4563407.1 OmpA family protein [Maribellus sp. CM-23]